MCSMDNIPFQGRHQAQTVTQLRDFVGKLGGLQNEHQALRLRTYSRLLLASCCELEIDILFCDGKPLDTGLAEEISTHTRTDQFNKGLEIQQSKYLYEGLLSCRCHHNVVYLADLLQGYETSAQITAIEELVAQHAPVDLVLRLLCLVNLTAGGVKVKILENLKREILQVGVKLSMLLEDHLIIYLTTSLTDMPTSHSYLTSPLSPSLPPYLFLNQTPPRNPLLQLPLHPSRPFGNPSVFCQTPSNQRLRMCHLYIQVMRL